MAKAAPATGPRTGPRLTLSLLRHAKATHEDYQGPDIERPLNRRGERNAAALGPWMATAGIAPQRILCSPARRTLQTLDLLLPHLAGKPAIEHPNDLYLSGPVLLLRHLHAVAKPDAHVLVIGHNPGLHALALDLIAEGPQDRIGLLGRKLPTCGLVTISFAVATWAEVLAGTGTLLSFTRPGDM
jgi:phosphohistidine phosphatase